MGRRGFTLTELLVVIAIIAVLAAILFPVFSKARDKARQSTCLSNMRQIGMAVQMYVQDYDETLPWCNDTTVINAPTGNFLTWQDIIMPYLSTGNVLVCPSSPFPTANPDGIPQTWIGNYGCNRRVLGPAVADTVLPYASLSKPADTYMIMDAGGYVIQAFDIPTPSYDQKSGWFRYLPGSAPYSDRSSIDIGSNADALSSALNGTAESDFKNGRHNGGVVMLFCDGHAKWLTAAEVCRQARQYIKDYNTPGFDSDFFATGVSGSAWAP